MSSDEQSDSEAAAAAIAKADEPASQGDLPLPLEGGELELLPAKGASTSAIETSMSAASVAGADERAPTADTGTGTGTATASLGPEGGGEDDEPDDETTRAAKAKAVRIEAINAGMITEIKVDAVHFFLDKMKEYEEAGLLFHECAGASGKVTVTSLKSALKLAQEEGRERALVPSNGSVSQIVDPDDDDEQESDEESDSGDGDYNDYKGSVNLRVASAKQLATEEGRLEGEMELLATKMAKGGGIVVWLEDFKTNHLSAGQKTSNHELYETNLKLWRALKNIASAEAFKELKEEGMKLLIEMCEEGQKDSLMDVEMAGLKGQLAIVKNASAAVQDKVLGKARDKGKSKATTPKKAQNKKPRLHPKPRK